MFQRSRPAFCGVSAAHHVIYALMPDPIFGERILQRDDEMWTVREVSADRVPGSRGARCLICESTTVVRRLWDYPKNWLNLTDDELLNLCAREAA